MKTQDFSNENVDVKHANPCLGMHTSKYCEKSHFILKFGTAIK